VSGAVQASDDGPGRAEAVVAAVRETLRTGRPATVPEEARSADLDAVMADLAGLYAFALSLSQGDLDQTLESRGALAGALKSLQSALRHLTWQTQRVAAGDFSQRVDFMGGFSDAFNGMVASLAMTHAQLTDSNEVLRRLNARLEILATTDKLTGACNRHKLDEVMHAELARSDRHELDLAVVMFDVDHFKRVNDTFGHDAGDGVLREISTITARQLRASDVLARWGGEEFLVLAPHTDMRQARMLAQRVRQGIGRHAFPKVGHVTASFGVAQHIAGEPADEFVSRADAALYRAKENGRDRVETAD